MNVRSTAVQKWTKNLAIIILVFNLFVKFFISQNIVPYSIQYLSDALLVIAFVGAAIIFFCSSKKTKKAIVLWFIPVFIFLLIEIISAVINRSELLLFLWHMRNYYRLFAFMFIAIICFDMRDIRKFFNIGYWILILHTVLVTIQLISFYLDFDGNFFHQDYLNGIFGTTQGYNTYSLIFLLVVSGYYAGCYLINECFKARAYISFALAGLVVAFSELKVYYYLVIVFFAILLLAKIVQKTRKKLLKKYICFAGIIAASYLIMGLLYPYVFSFFFDSEILREYIAKTSYGSEQITSIEVEQEPIPTETIQAGDNETVLPSTETQPTENTETGNTEISEEESVKIPKVNRLSAITIIPEYFFEDGLDYLFGIGTGNAEYSKNEHFCSDTYRLYGGIDYNRFTFSILLLETGFLGILVFGLVFGVWFLRFGYCFLKCKTAEKPIYYLSFFISFVALIDIVYDAALRSEASYFYGFAIAVGIICWLKQGSTNE